VKAQKEGSKKTYRRWKGDFFWGSSNRCKMFVNSKQAAGELKEKEARV